MAEFKSNYLQLGFYVNGEYKRFDGGRFVTEDEDTIKVLSNIPDVERVDEPKPEAKPAKAPARKTSAK
ncbi:hypothetical protein DOE78_18860 [Bacillus sp. Y1]|nr:hypothetical protein [Bacillus sp. Y1]AYA77342.1 hypothetical protein DOE78_18860 [Bacillus sp. Y1]